MFRLGDVCSKIGSGATPRGGSDVYLDEGPFSLIRSQNIYNDGFHKLGLAFINEEQAAELSNVDVQFTDVLINITGDSVARVCHAPAEVLPARVNQHVAIVRPDPTKLDPMFLRYSLVSPDMQALLLSLAGAGATRNALTKSVLESLEIAAPQSVSDQSTIARILTSLDDKIELNQRMSETLEAMARALFVNWFEAVPSDRVAASELIQAKVLEVGDGYRAKNSELTDSGVPFVRAGDLQTGFDLDGAECLSADSVKRVGSKMSRPDDVAFTSKGTIGRFARVGKQLRPFVYSPQVCYWRSLNPERLHPAVLYAWMVSSDFVDQLMSIAGQTDMAPYASLQDQRRITVPDFPISQHTIGANIEVLLDRAALAAQESSRLAGIRDGLLPSLVAGNTSSGYLAQESGGQG